MLSLCTSRLATSIKSMSWSPSRSKVVQTPVSTQASGPEIQGKEQRR